MKRRDALRNLALITGGLVLVPSCDFSKEDILSSYKNLDITPSLKQLLAEITDTIIPSGNLKGAADLEVHDFILVMVNDCIDDDGQKAFMKGLQGFESFSKKTAGNTFSKLSSSEKEKLILDGLASEAEDQKDTKTFLGMSKRFTVQGFMMSEYIQTEVKPYSLIPGDYQGEVLIADLKTDKING